MIKKIENFVDKFNSYFVLPLLVVFLLSYLRKEYSTSRVGVAINIVFSILFVAYLVLIIYKICKKTIKTQSLIWVLVTSLVLIVLSFVMSFGGNASISDIFFIAGVIFFEFYSLFVVIQCCFSEKTMITKAIIFSMIFIILGYYTIYLAAYEKSDNSMFNALISVFSAIIGGGITLIGVAWTIRNEAKERKEDQIEYNNVKKLEYKPYFSVKRIVDTGRKRHHIIDLNNPKYGYILDFFFVNKIKEDEEIFIMEPIVCINTDHSNFMVKRVDFLDDSIYLDELINRNENFAFFNEKRFFIKNKEEQLKFRVYIEDFIGNEYKFDFLFEYLRRSEDGPKGPIKYKLAVYRGMQEVK